MMWHLTSLSVKSITSESIRGPLLCLLLAPALLGHWNPFSIRLPTTGFPKLQFQHVLIDVGNVVSQTISVKIAQSLKPTNQLRLRRLSPSLTISSPVKILKHNTPVTMITIISQKMT